MAESMEATTAEARSIFDRTARRVLGMSGEEFLKQWDAGELTLSHADPRHGQIVQVAMCLPFVRPLGVSLP